MSAGIWGETAVLNGTHLTDALAIDTIAFLRAIRGIVLLTHVDDRELRGMHSTLRHQV